MTSSADANSVNSERKQRQNILRNHCSLPAFVRDGEICAKTNLLVCWLFTTQDKMWAFAIHDGGNRLTFVPGNTLAVSTENLEKFQSDMSVSKDKDADFRDRFDRSEFKSLSAVFDTIQASQGSDPMKNRRPPYSYTKVWKWNEKLKQYSDNDCSTLEQLRLVKLQSIMQQRGIVLTSITAAGKPTFQKKSKRKHQDQLLLLGDSSTSDNDTSESSSKRQRRQRQRRRQSLTLSSSSSASPPPPSLPSFFSPGVCVACHKKDCFWFLESRFPILSAAIDHLLCSGAPGNVTVEHLYESALVTLRKLMPGDLGHEITLDQLSDAQEQMQQSKQPSTSVSMRENVQRVLHDACGLSL